jgi:hypothetical protein
VLYLLNFGDSPFTFLFYLIIAIGTAVLIANGLAWLIAAIIKRKIRIVQGRHYEAEI